jgi:alanine racemase
MTGSAPTRTAEINLGAVTANVETLRRRVGTPHVMAVVKANAYGHGSIEVARAALAGGADWLGVADISEALVLRAAGIEAPILAWLHDADADFGRALAAGIDLGVSSIAQLLAVAAAQSEAEVQAQTGGRTPAAAIQLKLETGLSRNGLAPADWAEAFGVAHELERAGKVRVRGIFSHLSNASPDDDAAAIRLFTEGLERAGQAGLTPNLMHMASTAGALRLPEARFNLVRLGIGIYGLSPFADQSSEDLGLVPAMTLRGRIAAVRRVEPGTGVSYDYIWRAAEPTNLALVPLGYAEGVPRAASNLAEVYIGGKRYPVRGRIAMDQLVVDVGDTPVAVGDEVILFGDPRTGAPSADEWAAWASTINYEIVTRVGPRVRRRFSGS